MLVIPDGHSHSIDFNFVWLLSCVFSCASLDVQGETIMKRFLCPYAWQDQGDDPAGIYTKAQVIGDSQHAFTKGKSHPANLVAFYNGATELVGKGRGTAVMCLDLCKEFDTVPYYILVAKL